MAKPETAPDGSVNLMVWQCSIPGKQGVTLSHKPKPFSSFIFNFFFLSNSRFPYLNVFRYLIVCEISNFDILASLNFVLLMKSCCSLLLSFDFWGRFGMELKSRSVD